MEKGTVKGTVAHLSLCRSLSLSYFPVSLSSLLNKQLPFLASFLGQSLLIFHGDKNNHLLYRR